MNLRWCALMNENLEERRADLKEILKNILPLFDLTLEKVHFTMGYVRLEMFRNEIIFDGGSLAVLAAWKEEVLENEDVEDARSLMQEFLSDVNTLKEEHKDPFRSTATD